MSLSVSTMQVPNAFFGLYTLYPEEQMFGTLALNCALDRFAKANQAAISAKRNKALVSGNHTAVCQWDIVMTFANALLDFNETIDCVHTCEVVVTRKTITLSIAASTMDTNEATGNHFFRTTQRQFRFPAFDSCVYVIGDSMIKNVVTFSV